MSTIAPRLLLISSNTLRSHLGGRISRTRTSRDHASFLDTPAGVRGLAFVTKREAGHRAIPIALNSMSRAAVPLAATHRPSFFIPAPALPKLETSPRSVAVSAMLGPRPAIIRVDTSMGAARPAVPVAPMKRPTFKDGSGSGRSVGGMGRVLGCFIGS
ncbi:uncharacterized protein H6S33_010924 [Morchella sextelata]|uniref:uncharacterized protein n=1 Tax=Morchella sextelata TaxID=1174677 RepID=UPI001D045782|nr:uncharacterized protein H6S33_010924 [Morchella sextelata]KAH0611659.1 hypothetical protein H6S33_010924 [Morchella sextelata]